MIALVSVCDPGGCQTKRYLTGRNGKKLLVTGTPHVMARSVSTRVNAIGFALGAEKPSDLHYITDDTLWFEGTGDVARDLAEGAGKAESSVSSGLFRGRFPRTRGGSFFGRPRLAA